MQIGLGIGIPFTKSQVWLAVQTIFTPASLFTSGVNGVWYDPSDLTTLYRDSAGTLPVTAVEQPVGLMKDKSGRGNHAFNPSGNSANFPVLSARYNLLTKTEDFSSSDWNLNQNVVISKPAVSGVTGAGTVQKITPTETNGQHNIQRVVTGQKTAAYIKSDGYGFCFWYWAGNSGYINLSNGAVTGVSGVAPVVYSSVNGWWRVELTTSNIGTTYFAIGVAVSSGVNSFAGNGVDGILVCGSDIRVANDALNQPAYQRVNTATDYDTVGFKPYLKFNGTNQWLQTNSIDFSYGDKLFVAAGVRKLADAYGVVIEASSNVLPNPGAFGLISAGWASAGFKYGAALSGSEGAFSLDTAAAYPSPRSDIVTTVSNIAGAIYTDELQIRINGAQVNGSVSGTSIGITGNFGNHMLYIGARAGYTLWFNGRLYGMVVAGKQASDTEIQDTEKYMNLKTAAYN